ncbi:uncharacterized protein [Ptychodera flava]|uniref:uncharacterized protein n=1 Tax=Ptychodera flava TaxID=63121 RepID=UPI00396A0576
MVEDSFALSEIEAALADVTATEDPRSCNCSGVCGRKRGRGACPCRAFHEFCKTACTCGKRRPCSNIAVQDSTSDDEEGSENHPPASESVKKRPRDTQEQQTQAELLEENERQMKEFVQKATREDLETLTLELLRRQPGAWCDVQQLHPAPNPYPQPGPGSVPSWCKCGHCCEMPTQQENKCCATRRNQTCITDNWLFTHLVLDANVLEIAMRCIADTYAEEQLRDNACFRHYAYRQYIYWQHGKLGAGNRRVVPSCCVWAIRADFQAQTIYMSAIKMVQYRIRATFLFLCF